MRVEKSKFWLRSGQEHAVPKPPTPSSGQRSIPALARRSIPGQKESCKIEVPYAETGQSRQVLNAESRPTLVRPSSVGC